MTQIKKIVAVGAAFVVFAFPGMAFAQADEFGYDPPGTSIQTSLQSSGDPSDPADEGSLPFTGSDLGVLATAGGLLVLLGFGLRRLTHRAYEA